MSLFTLRRRITFIMVPFVFLSFQDHEKKTEIVDFNALSEEFLQCAKDNKSTARFREKLSNTTLHELNEGLGTADQKLAFWINVYNAYIQVILQKNPAFYNNRGTFFEKEQIPIAGEMVSFNKIEHGILRKSQWPLGLGYIRKWFPDRFERKLRVDQRDYRIHFALNCGAKDCPPVAIYTPDRINEQLAKGTELYLKKTSEYRKETNEVTVTPLFSWFRGDFGAKNGIKAILKDHDIIPTTQGIDISFKNYDWTLDLENWITL